MSLVTYGLGASGGGGGAFLMRAFRSLSSNYVYWVSENEPDPSAAGAPYPAIELSDIVVASVYVSGG